MACFENTSLRGIGSASHACSTTAMLGVSLPKTSPLLISPHPHKPPLFPDCQKNTMSPLFISLIDLVTFHCAIRPRPASFRQALL
jgi:hypothetical protein